jgi:thiol-disulfide isomerase/thioredoxin
LSDILAQGKPVVLNMWAGLCPVCREEMPILQQVYEEYGESVLVFGLDVGVFAGLGSEEDARALLDELEITYPAGTTPDEGVMQEYQVFGVPALYFITPDAEIVQRHYGMLTAGELSGHVGALLELSKGRGFDDVWTMAGKGVGGIDAADGGGAILSAGVPAGGQGPAGRIR